MSRSKLVSTCGAGVMFHEFWARLGASASVGMNVHGIFRQPGRHATIQSLVDLYNNSAIKGKALPELSTLSVVPHVQ